MNYILEETRKLFLQSEVNKNLNIPESNYSEDIDSPNRIDDQYSLLATETVKDTSVKNDILVTEESIQEKNSAPESIEFVPQENNWIFTQSYILSVISAIPPCKQSIIEIHA